MYIFLVRLIQTKDSSLQGKKTKSTKKFSDLINLLKTIITGNRLLTHLPNTAKLNIICPRNNVYLVRNVKQLHKQIINFDVDLFGFNKSELQEIIFFIK